MNFVEELGQALDFIDDDQPRRGRDLLAEALRGNQEFRVVPVVE